MVYYSGVLNSDTFKNVEKKLYCLLNGNFSIDKIELLYNFVIQNPFINDDKISFYLKSLICWSNNVEDSECINNFKKFTNKEVNKFIYLFERIDSGNFDQSIKNKYVYLYDLLLMVCFTKSSLIHCVDLLFEEFYVIKKYEYLFNENKDKYIYYFIKNAEDRNYLADNTIYFCNETLKSINKNSIKNVYKDIITYFDLLSL